MTKYKLNNTVHSSSEVTLTSYLPSGGEEKLDSNQNGTVDGGNKCHFCPHSCQFLRQTEQLAAELMKGESDRFGLNELKVENLDQGVCLCAKYNGGCRGCRAPRRVVGKDACGTCSGNSCPTTYSSKFVFLSFYLVSWLVLKT